MEKTAPHYLQHRSRLKKKFRESPQAIHDAELIELLLGYVIPRRDVKPQAKEILKMAGSLGNIFNEDLKSIKGVGPEVCTFFEALREFITRASYQNIENKEYTLGLSSEVYEFLRAKIGHSSKENFALILLDNKNRVKSCKVIRKGTVGSVSMHARDIIETAMEYNATRVIIAHNHPSGDPSPSLSDLKVTTEICHALRFTGIQLLDHIIITNHDYYSMEGHKDMEKIKAEVEKKFTRK